VTASTVPKLGLASLALPLVLVAVWLLLERGGMERLGYLAPVATALLLVATGGAILGGAALGAQGWLRGERPRIVPALGFLVNAGIALLFVMAR
jgi:hypothetical protein